MNSDICFGIVADVQYADKDNGSIGGSCQYYREADQKLREAIAAFKGRQPQPAFVLSLGDIIDGYPEVAPGLVDLEHIAAVVAELAPIPVHHVIGNHCLKVGRTTLQQRLGTSQPYYSLALGPGWVLLVLDTTEVSLHSGYPQDSPQAHETQAFLQQHAASPPPNIHRWNGGLSSAQHAWLQQQLAAAEQQGCRVLVASHHPLCQGSASEEHLAWNWQATSDMLLGSSAFVAALAGHYHSGGYCCKDGRHFVTLQAILEAPSGSNAYGYVHLHQDRIVIEGYGTLESRELLLQTDGQGKAARAVPGQKEAAAATVPE